jgi:hypothetical protein
MEGGEEPHESVQARVGVGHREGDVGGLVAVDERLAGEEAHLGVDDRRVGGAAALGAGLAESGDRQHDQPGVDLLHVLPGQAELGHDPGPVVLHHDVGLGDELQHQLAGAFGQQVDADGALSGVLLVVVAADAVDLPAHQAGHVPFRGLHLQDVGAEVRQHTGGEGARQHAGEVQDANACQGIVHVAFSSASGRPRAAPRAEVLVQPRVAVRARDQRCTSEGPS